MYKYYKSDFPIHLHLDIKAEGNSGELVPVTTAKPFNLRFFIDQKGTPETGYVASFDGTTLRNCSVITPSDIMVYIDRDQMPLPTGKLMLEVEFLIANTHYASDSTQNLKRLYSTGIELTDNPDLDTNGNIDIQLFNDIVSHEIVASVQSIIQSFGIDVVSPMLDQLNGTTN